MIFGVPWWQVVFIGGVVWFSSMYSAGVFLTLGYHAGDWLWRRLVIIKSWRRRLRERRQRRRDAAIERLDFVEWGHEVDAALREGVHPTDLDG